MVDEPRVGDAFGELMRAALAERTGRGPRPTFAGRVTRPVIEIVERDDGFINGAPAARYVAGPAEWYDWDRRALDRLDGHVLDVGAGAGRVALALQERGTPVTALDISPGAVEVATRLGVWDTVCATVDDHARSGSRYDTFAFFGNNLGLLESPRRAPVLLAALAELARPGARIVAQGTDPYGTTDPAHLAYHQRNRDRGRMPGQLRIRVRYEDLTTAWFDYLLCSVDELTGLVQDSPWRVGAVDDADAPVYVAELVLR
ncbi:MAG TPA: methyltransferase domain-containing protein [Micromonosporaceae bacterium]|nr:methyltransferase domain-containing protein [Micromonosporaceae bacterium]